jgi:acetyl-CoA carboxylase biotin carboxyl carrier protein
MSDTEKTPDRAMVEAVWAEARDLIRRLEGSSVQRFAVSAGDYSIEIERGGVAPLPAAEAGAAPPPSAAIGSATSGMSIAPGARMASGVFTLGDMPPADNRVPVLSPLVGTFYEAATPGAKPFAAVGDVVEAGQTVCIVEAMKMMNEVAAGEGGKVVEIAVANGEACEFEQVLMYLEPTEG